MTYENTDKGIKIKHVHGGTTADEADLKGCYFQLTGAAGQYIFFDQSDDQISTTPSPLTSGTDFTFALPTSPDVTWSVTDFVISGTNQNGEASGTWFTPPAQDEGTFQAQSGQGVDEDESASSANA